MQDPNPSPPSPKLKPHRGDLMTMLGILCLFVAPLIVAPLTWLMARADLKEMDEGRMDPAGRQQTTTARLLAMISTCVWPTLLSCWCCSSLANQMVNGGRFFSAWESRRVTRQEFERVQPGMPKEQVRGILGTPAKTQIDEGRPYWYWYEKNGRATFSADFNESGKVAGLRISTPD